MRVRVPPLPVRLRRQGLAAQLLVAQMILAGGALVLNVIAARTLGPAARGELALLLQIAYAANLVALLGRHRAYLRLLLPDRNLGAALAGVRLLGRLPVVIALTISLLVGVAFGQSWGALALTCAFFLKSVGGVLVNAHRAAAIAAGSGRHFMLATAATQILLAIGALLLAHLDVTSVSAWLLLYGVTALVPYSVVDLLARRHFPGAGVPLADLREVKELGLRFVPPTVAEALLVRADRFLLPALASYAQLGIFAVVVTMTELASWPVKQFTDAQVSVWRKTLSGSSIRWARILVPPTVVSLIVSIVVGAVTYLLLEPLFGPEYISGQVLVLPLTIAALLYSLTLCGSNLMLAADRSRWATVISVSGLLCALPAYVLLIPSYGALGAAWGSVAGYALSVVVSIVGVGALARGRGARLVEESVK